MLLELSGLGKKALERELRDAAGLPNDKELSNSIFRYKAGRVAALDGPGSVVDIADQIYPGTAATYRSVLWKALARPSPADMLEQLISANEDVASLWAICQTAGGMKTLAENPNLNAGGVLALKLRTSGCTRPMETPSLALATRKWFAYHWPERFERQLLPLLMERLPAYGRIGSLAGDKRHFDRQKVRPSASGHAMFLMFC